MPISKTAYQDLDRISGGSSPRTYGRASTIRKAQPHLTQDLPRKMVFMDEMSGDVFQLSYNGAVQFLRKMHYDGSPNQVDWLLDNLINIPTDGSFPMEGAELSLSFECDYDPQGRTLAQMGIAKSMVCKSPNVPPGQMDRIMSRDGPQSGPMNEQQLYMKKCNIPFGRGEKDGVFFGMEVMNLNNKLRKGALRTSKNSYAGYDDKTDDGGMLGRCNVQGSYRLPRSNVGWQDE